MFQLFTYLITSLCHLGIVVSYYFLTRFDFLLTVDLVLFAGCFLFLFVICLGGGTVVSAMHSVDIDSTGLS